MGAKDEYCELKTKLTQSQGNCVVRIGCPEDKGRSVETNPDSVWELDLEETRDKSVEC